MALAEKQNARSDTLFKATEPGLEMAESFYKRLASGNMKDIGMVAAPASEAIAGKYEAAKKAISTEMPRGGAKDLAVEEADLSKSGQIGSVEANAYLASFPALANLAGQGVGLSINEVSTALAAFSGASSSNQAAGNMEGAGKAQTLGFLGSLAGAGAEVGSAAITHCWIAEVIFGRNDLRTIRLRVWLNDVYGKTFVGSLVMCVYRHYGQWVAAQAEKRHWLRRMLTPIFEAANRAAYRWEKGWADVIRNAGLI